MIGIEIILFPCKRSFLEYLQKLDRDSIAKYIFQFY